MSNDGSRKLARMHLDLAQALYRRREDLGFAVEDLADSVGMTPERIVMIEEGDTSSLSEIAQLCQELRIELTIDDDFLFRIAPIGEVRFFAGPPQGQITTKAGSAPHINASADQQGFFTSPSTTGKSLTHARR